MENFIFCAVVNTIQSESFQGSQGNKTCVGARDMNLGHRVRFHVNN